MTTSAVRSVFVDTNILVYTKLSLSPFYQLALDRINELESQDCEFWLSRQIFREYASVMSRPTIVTGSIPITSITQDIRDFSVSYKIAEDGSITTDKWLALLDKIPTSGKQVHDANIVATMQANSIGSLLTHNISDFARFSGMINLLPLIV